jgi:hypothetical protein
MFAALRSRLAETAFLYRSGLAAVPDLRPFPSPAPARFTACPAASRRSCLKRADLHLAEASCMPSLDRRVDRHHRHPWDQNLRFFKALRLSVPVASPIHIRLTITFRMRQVYCLLAVLRGSSAGFCSHSLVWLTSRSSFLQSLLSESRLQSFRKPSKNPGFQSRLAT